MLFSMVGVPIAQAVAMAFAVNLLRFAVGAVGGIVTLISGIRRAVETDPSTV